MKLKSVCFEDVDGVAYPSTVTVEMSIEQAAVYAALLSSLSPAAWKALEPRWADGYGDGMAYGDCAGYGTLVGDVFNRYWDDGLRDVLVLGKDLNTIVLAAKDCEDE